MPRKTKAELAAEKENENMMEMTEMGETAPDSADTGDLPEEPQEAATMGLLADYSAASENSSESPEPEPSEEESPEGTVTEASPAAGSVEIDGASESAALHEPVG